MISSLGHSYREVLPGSANLTADLTAVCDGKNAFAAGLHRELRLVTLAQLQAPENEDISMPVAPAMKWT